MVYEILSEEERAKRIYGEAGIDIVAPPKETRKQKIIRKLAGARIRARERARERIKKIPSYAKTGAKVIIKKVSGTPEQRKQRRATLMKMLKGQSQRKTGFNNQYIFSGEPCGMKYFLGPESSNKRKGRTPPRQKRIRWF